MKVFQETFSFILKSEALVPTLARCVTKKVWPLLRDQEISVRYASILCLGDHNCNITWHVAKHQCFGCSRNIGYATLNIIHSHYHKQPSQDLSFQNIHPYVISY